MAGNSEKRAKAQWDTITTKVFCEICAEEENKEYAKFEHNGLENAAELDTMFGRTISTGETAWTPAAGPIFSDQQGVGGENVVDLEEGSGDSDELFMGTQAEGSSEKRKKSTAGCSSITKGKKLKSGGAAYMQRQLDCLCNAVETYASASLTTSSKKNYEELDGDVGECMDLLLTLPGIEDGSELYMLGTRLFMKRGNRVMFKSIRSANSKVSWLKQELERENLGKI